VYLVLPVWQYLLAHMVLFVYSTLPVGHFLFHEHFLFPEQSDERFMFHEQALFE